MIRPYRGARPVIDPSVYVDPQATIIGDVVIGPHSSVWCHAVIRGDVNIIRVGARTNIQDLSMLHVTPGPRRSTWGTRSRSGMARFCTGAPSRVDV